MTNPNVGKTPLRSIPELCEAYHLPNLFVKDESTNPSGTWKDRRSLSVVRHLNGRPDPHVCLVTAGNAAMSIAKISNGAHLRITAIVSETIDPGICQHMKDAGIEVIPTSLKERLTPNQVEHLAQNGLNDHPIDITNFMHRAYAQVIYELRHLEADYILAPYGTGEGVFGMAIENYRSPMHEPHHISKLVGVKPRAEISQADKLAGSISPYPLFLEEYKPYGQQDVFVDEDEISQAYATVSRHLLVEPSSAATFAGLSHLHLKSSDKVVVINSGRGIF